MLIATLLLSATLAAKAPVEATTPPPDANVELALELIEVARMDQTFKAMEGQIRTMMKQQMMESAGCDAARAKLEPLADDMAGVVNGEIQSEKMRTDIAAVYSESFSEDDLRELIAFYHSPLGQKMLDRMPGVMQRTMLITQGMMRSMMPKMREVIDSHKSDLQDAAKLCRTDGG